MDSTLSYEQAEREHFQLAQFERLGLDLDVAIDAINRGVDWHEVKRLKDNGCSLSLALKIAEPLEVTV